MVVGVRARREGRTGRSREEGGEAEEPALPREAGVSPRCWGGINSRTMERGAGLVWKGVVAAAVSSGDEGWALTQSGASLYLKAQRSLHMAGPGCSSEVGRCLGAQEGGSPGAMAVFPVE